MHPFERRSPELPRGVSKHLNIRLKPGWRFDHRRYALVPDTGRTISLKRLLPQGAEVVPTVPPLAGVDPKKLSEDESILARSLQVVLPSASSPSQVDMSKLAADLTHLEGVESVSKGPQLDLP